MRRPAESLPGGPPCKIRRTNSECSRPTLRGLVTGSIRIGSLSDAVPVIVWGDDFPSWLLVLGELRLRARVVVLSSEAHLTFVKSLVDADCLIVSTDQARSVMTPELTGGCSLCLMNSRVVPDTARLLQTCGVTRIVGTRGLRRPIPEWTHDSWRSSHWKLGGVTTEEVVGVCLTFGKIGPDAQVILEGVGRDASTVLSVKAPARKYRPAPGNTTVSPLGCMQLGTPRAPVFHGGGLLPEHCDKRTLVLAPGLFAPKGTWAQRNLTVEEVLIAKDWGRVAIDLLGTGVLTNLFLRDLLPGKCLVALATKWGCNNGGGDAFFSIPQALDSPKPAAKRSKKEPSRNLEEYEKEEVDLVLDLIGKSEEQSERPVKNQTSEVVLQHDEGTARADAANTVPSDAVIEDVARQTRERKAVKSDDAAVPEYLWEDHLMAGSQNKKWDNEAMHALRTMSSWLRERMLCWWKRQVVSSYVKWMKDKYQVQDPATELTVLSDLAGKGKEWFRYGKDRYAWAHDGRNLYRKWWKERLVETIEDIVTASDAIARAAGCSWWGWDEGSRPFHWRWPEHYQNVIRDGLKVYFQDLPPKYRKSQRDISDEAIKAKVREKLAKVRKRGYIAPGFVESLTAFFEVEKGEDDIRLVYDGSVSGLNLTIWVPRFFLPTVRTHLRAVDANTFMADVDIGEMFLNFILHRDLRALAGVDLSHYFEGEKEGPLWEAWQRAAMGLRSSPYQCVQAMGIAEEVIRGDPADAANVFRWDRVELNLPGSEAYDPSRPWVAKYRSEDGHLASDLFIFVDDLRPTGPSQEEAWLAARRAASTLNYLGIQDAPQKRRESSQSPGAWAGSLIKTGQDGTFVLTSQEKWDKARAQVQEVLAMLTKDPTKLNRKRLEQIRGFLQYVTQTYTSMTSYLIGFHMTIDSWRSGRDDEGWRLPLSAWRNFDKTDDDWSGVEEVAPEEEAPVLVSAVPRLQHDIAALLKLLEPEKPPLKRVRAKATAKVYYGFGDASGCGFGATIQIGEEIIYEYGQWSSEVTETKSSNWRELNNLVEALERIVKEYALEGSEIFIFTDNTTAEAAFWKGTSKSKTLFELVLRLKVLELDYGLILHVIHVSGRRMIAQGTDGLSRADHSEGVMRGRDMKTFIPLHLTAHAREPKVKEWFEGATSGLDFSWLSPAGWFSDAHTQGNFIWSVPPAAAEVVVEQLGFARLKRPEAFHIILVPRLMTGRWRRHLTRATDGYIKIDDPAVWNLDSHFEPLLAFFCLPYNSYAPKLEERRKIVGQLQGLVSKPDVPTIPSSARGRFLRKLLVKARELCPLRRSVVPRVLRAIGSP